MEVENKSGQQTPRTTARRSRPSGSGNKPDWPPILEREIMTPREKLVNDYSEKFGGNAGFEVLRDMENNMEQLLEPYAIGKWVPVEERLPDDRQTVVTRWDDGSVSFIAMVKDGKWSFYSNDSKITHWLDLDMPEVES